MRRAEFRSAAATAPLCVELHDVAPATWPQCARVLRMIDAVGPVPVSLLVVPDYHHRGTIRSDPAFLRAVDERLARGDEVALHGLYHLDEGARPRRLKDWFKRRVRTLAEGEFAGVDRDTAREHIAQGQAELLGAGWPLSGFVPPAWLLGEPARAALNGFGFTYTALREGFFRLPDWAFLPTTTLSYAAFKPVRRALSGPVLSYLYERAPRNRVLRLAIHPVDARYPRVLDHWQRLLRTALRQRVAMTGSAVVATFLPADGALHAARGPLPKPGPNARAPTDAASRR